MNPARAKKMRDAEEAYGKPFWQIVRELAREGMSRARAGEFVGYSKWGFYELLYSSDAPSDIPWWSVPVTLYDQPKRDPDAIERARQARLRHSDIVWITHQGETLPLLEWARRFCLNHETIRGRYRRGIRGRALFDKPMSRQERGRLGLQKRKEQAAENN